MLQNQFSVWGTNIRVKVKLEPMEGQGPKSGQVSTYNDRCPYPWTLWTLFTVAMNMIDESSIS